jgi:hypothetical protein
MKKLNRQSVFIVLAVHISILLLISGGLNALGCAVVLGIPFVGCIAWFAYQQGKYSRDNSKRVKELSSPALGLFRG